MNDPCAFSPSLARAFVSALTLVLVVLGSVPPAGARTVTVLNPAGIRADGAFVDQLLKEAMANSGLKKPRLAADFPRQRAEEVEITADELSEINELFYHRGWTDGLPIVPPTPERVAWMLAGADISPDFVIASLDPMGGQANIEKIAVNAVMAGCQPAYMPILIAAVEAVSGPEFDLRGVSTTTNPDTPLLLVSGPVVTELGLNCGTNTFGRGWRANAAISRALHLILQNVGGGWPGVTDMSTLGQPGEFVMLLAENAAANPWQPVHMALGLPQAASAVTVMAAEGYLGVLGIGQSCEGYLKLIASALKGQDRPYRSSVLLVVAQDTAGMLAHAGWTKEKIEQFIREAAKVPFGEFKEQFIDTNMAQRGVPAWAFKIGDPAQLVSKPFIDQMLIVVAGGTGEKSLLVPGWTAGHAVSREIRLPSNWRELLAADRYQ